MEKTYLVKESRLSDIADAIREKIGGSDTITVEEMPEKIGSITGGIDTSDATATADEILEGETAYVNGEKITGSFTIDSELATQDDLIAQIQSVVDSLPEAGGSTQTATLTISFNSPTGGSENLYYNSADGVQILSLMDYEPLPFSVNCIVPSIICFDGGSVF